MMAKKDRFAPGFSTSFAPRDASEGSNDSGNVDSTEHSSVLTRKWIDVNSSARDGLAVPMQVISVSKLSTSERKKLLHRLTSELKKIQNLQNKIDSEKKINVNGAAQSSVLGSGSEREKKRPETSSVKKTSGLGSGSRGKASSLNRGVTGRFEPVNQKGRATADAELFRQCDSLLKKLMGQQYSWVFNTPVDVVQLKIPDYFDIIKNPMDLGTIKKKLTSGKYSSPLEFLDDVRLTFSNAKTYNPPGSDVHVIAETMSQFFEVRWKAIEKKLATRTPKTLPKTSGILEDRENIKPLSPMKKRKLSPVSPEVIVEHTVQKMSDEEKLRMSRELEDFGGDLPESIVEFLKSQSSNSGDEDEIEIDIDELGDETLFTLRKLLDVHLLEKQKNLIKSEVCEIELPNVSGFSNSSAHADKGSDPVDQDVDIGENEVALCTDPLVLVDQDADGLAEESSRGVSSGLEPALCMKSYEPSSGDQLDASGERVQQLERQVSPDKLYRAALLKNRFADTILKAREKTLTQDDKADPEKLRREREELEMLKKKEKARLQEEARAAEDARRRLEEEAAAKERRKIELEREAAREALLKMEKTVEINENSRFLEDLEMLRVAPPEQLPSSVDETSPDHSQDAFGSFKFVGSSNPLEQLGLYMKVDEEEEEAEPSGLPITKTDVEEGEIDYPQPTLPPTQEEQEMPHSSE